MAGPNSDNSHTKPLLESTIDMPGSEHDRSRSRSRLLGPGSVHRIGLANDSYSPRPRFRRARLRRARSVGSIDRFRMAADGHVWIAGPQGNGIQQNVKDGAKNVSLTITAVSMIYGTELAMIGLSKTNFQDHHKLFWSSLAFMTSAAVICVLLKHSTNFGGRWRSAVCYSVYALFGLAIVTLAGILVRSTGSFL